MMIRQQETLEIPELLQYNPVTEQYERIGIIHSLIGGLRSPLKMMVYVSRATFGQIEAAFMSDNYQDYKIRLQDSTKKTIMFKGMIIEIPETFTSNNIEIKLIRGSPVRFGYDNDEEKTTANKLLNLIKKWWQKAADLQNRNLHDKLKVT